MNLKIAKILIAAISGSLLFACTEQTSSPVLDHNKLASQYYQEDAQWYLDNIPFFECSDQQIEQVYYYRWKMYKAHIHHVGENRYVTTEFINDMHWDIDPYSTINAATMHHIYEGRWLKDDRYMDGYINYMYQDGGNNRQYSESIADASYARYLVNSDSSILLRNLDSMERIYNGWYDHFDSSKNLYYIPAMPDATEYTIASIDQAGGKEGFSGGEAFRPTINSYMYGNALAISKIAAMKGDMEASRKYLAIATNLKANIQQSLWSDSFQHFIDRHQAENQYVHYWQFIRGRELAGMAPWYFNLPDDNPKYNAAWKHAIDTSQLLGQYGFRTNEPSYQYYFKQFTYNENGQRGSQWNGPSWPYQSSQVITGMANFLNNYTQDVVTNSDYVHVLRQFTQQHYLPNGKINLVENYDPNLGGPIVYFYWSNHYNHSSYNNLVITGLCGIRPSESDTLVINPLVDSSIRYFCLDGLLYHGHSLTVVYDRDGSKYHLGQGLTVFVDGKKSALTSNQRKNEVFVGRPILTKSPKETTDYALNIRSKGFPTPSASYNSKPDSLYQAIDGRIWYFPEVSNRWSTLGSTSKSDWYAIDFGAPKEISSINLYLYSDGDRFAVPDSYKIEYQNGDKWIPINIKEQKPAKTTGNTVNKIAFEKVTAKAIRVEFEHATKAIGLTELECY